MIELKFNDGSRGMQRIYLDYNSTAPIAPEVTEAIADCYRQGFANPASQHRPGQAARKRLEQDRAQIVAMLGGKIAGMDADSLVFTSGGTESNNLALRGLLSVQFPKGYSHHRVLVSAIEHPSVLAASEFLQQTGVEVERIPVDAFGVCRLESLAELLERPASLVSVMLANNETGVIQPIKQIAQLCREKGVTCHSDAVQVVGKVRLNFSRFGSRCHDLYGSQIGGAPRHWGPVAALRGNCQADSVWRISTDGGPPWHRRRRPRSGFSQGN